MLLLQLVLVLSFWFWVVRSRFQLDSCTLSVFINKYMRAERIGKDTEELVELVDEKNQIEIIQLLG